MKHTVKNNGFCKRELGLKLLNFRNKLALSIGEKKITQPAFGEMYGGYSGRVIASYETGVVDPPASLLYELWRSGHSIDSLFSEGPIAEPGRLRARDLFDNAVTTKVEDLNEVELQRLLREAKASEKKNHGNGSHKTTVETPDEGEGGADPSSKNKKRKS